MTTADSEYDVIIAGLGVMGAAAAWQLAARGQRVLGLDRYQPPHTQGSSHGGSRVIREMAFEHPRYVPLARRSYTLWAQLEAATKRQLLIPTGAVYIGGPSSSVVGGSRASAEAHGIASESLTSEEVAARWPQFRPDAGMVGLLEHQAGVLRPELCVQGLLDAAIAHGASIQLGQPLTGWSADRSRVLVETPAGIFTARHLVLAMGPWIRQELERAGASVWIERVVQQWFTPVDAALMEPSRCPIYLFEDTDGVIVYGFPMLDGVVKAAVHHRGESVDPDTVRRDVSREEVERVQHYLARWLPAANGPHQRSAVCLYTNAPDGDFIIDRHPRHDRVILLSPCAGIGFKFAPVIGEIAADLVTGKRPAFDLAPFALNRPGLAPPR